MTARWAAWLVLVAALAGCVQPEKAQPAASPPAPEPVANEPEPAEPAPPPKPDQVVSYPDTDPEMLLNRDTAEMADLLGTPGRIEDQPPALIWIYEVEKVCTLRLFFYPELNGDRFLSLTYDIEPAPDLAAEKACIDTLRRAHVG